MEFNDVVRRRRMVRSFEERPLEAVAVEALTGVLGRAPSAGNTRGSSWIVLDGPTETARYWESVTTPEWRRSSRRWPGLRRAPLILLGLTSPGAYLERYGEDDKRSSGLGPMAASGGGPGAWPVPYWWGDVASEALLVLLAAADQGLGACFLGNFRGEDVLLARLGVPGGWRLYGAVLAGHPDGADHPSASLTRSLGVPVGALHRGRWGEEPTSWPAPARGASGGRGSLAP